MNDYKFSELEIGLKESFSKEITSEMMDMFYKITGDCNPLHCNEDFSIEKGFRGRVVYGMLTSSLISTLGGVYLPGKNCLIQGVETKFSRPVYIGDVLNVMGEVVEKHDSVKQATIKVIIRNQDNKVVCKGKLRVGVLDEG